MWLSQRYDDLEKEMQRHKKKVGGLVVTSDHSNKQSKFNLPPQAPQLDLEHKRSPVPPVEH